MLNPDFRDMFSALCDEGVEFLLVGAYARSWTSPRLNPIHLPPRSTRLVPDERQDCRGRACPEPAETRAELSRSGLVLPLRGAQQAAPLRLHHPESTPRILRDCFAAPRHDTAFRIVTLPSVARETACACFGVLGSSV
jgi:hypothetical protein